MPGKSSIWCKLFQKFEIWFQFRKFRKISHFQKKCRRRRSCSTRYPSGNQVDGSPLVANTEPRWIGVTLAPRRFMIMVDIFMFLMIFRIRSYWFVTFISFISYRSLILCDYQLPSSTEPLSTTGVTLRRNDEKMMKFSKNPPAPLEGATRLRGIML